MPVKQSRENAYLHTPEDYLLVPTCVMGTTHLGGDSHLASGFRLGGGKWGLPQSEPPEGIMWNYLHPKGWLQSISH